MGTQRVHSARVSSRVWELCPHISTSLEWGSQKELLYKGSGLFFSWKYCKLLEGRDYFLSRCSHNVSFILDFCNKYHRLGGLNNRHLFLRLEAGDQGASLVRSLLSALFLGGCRQRETFLPSYRGMDPIHEGWDLIVPQGPYLLILSPGGIGVLYFNTFYFGLGYNCNNVVIVSREKQRESAAHRHVSILPQTLLPSRLPHCFEQSFLCYTVGPYWLFILNTEVCTCPSQTP